MGETRPCFLLVICLALLIPTATACQAPPPHEFAGAELNAPQPAPNFELTSAAGPVQLNNFAGNYVFLYFGYTFCPDVCPITLQTLKNAKSTLPPDRAERVQVLMVTVDPERDTADRLAEYMAYFDDSFIGLTGSQNDIDAAGEPFGIFYEKMDGSPATGYLINHSSRFYLIDPTGTARIAYPHDTTAEQLTTDLNHLMDNES